MSWKATRRRLRPVPQPLPPGPDDVIAIEGALLAVRLADGAVLTHAQSEGGTAFLEKVVDEWCGTTGSHPWPPGWPHLHIGGPDPSPWHDAAMFAAASVVFARFSSGLADARLRDAFRAGAEKLGDRAVSEVTQER